MQEKTATGAPLKYKGPFSAMVLIVREEGVGQLYRGLLPRMLRVPPGMVRALCRRRSDGSKGYRPGDFTIINSHTFVP